MSGEPVLAEGPGSAGDKCDFCMSPEIVARYLCKTFKVHIRTANGPLDYTSNADWAACRACHDLIQADRWDDLAKRSHDANMTDGIDETSPEQEALMMEFLKALHSGFRHHRIKLHEGRKI